MVELTGEAYFEVAHQPHRPFTVKSKGQSVHVLGTEFNINAYPNEATAGTTLVKGSIRIRKPGSGTARTLKPGQQALLYPEIGRASCRERVCQFVEISVVAGALKKKKQ